MKNRLQLRIEGEAGQITLEAFTNVLNRARLTISEIDSAISERPNGAFDWVITDLALRESAIAEVAPRGRVPEADDRLGLLVGTNFVHGLQTIERGDERLPPYFSDTGLTRVRWIANHLEKIGVGPFEAHLNSDANITASVTERAAGNVQRLLEPKSKAIGSVSGKLELINVHGEKPVYNVYDAVTKRAVRCAFDRKELDEVAAALSRRVLVSGIVHRNQYGEPVRIERPSLRVMRDDRDLPTTSEIAGLAPDLTGDLASDEYVRRLRDG